MAPCRPRRNTNERGCPFLDGSSASGMCVRFFLCWGQGQEGEGTSEGVARRQGRRRRRRPAGRGSWQAWRAHRRMHAWTDPPRARHGALNWPLGALPGAERSLVGLRGAWSVLWMQEELVDGSARSQDMQGRRKRPTQVCMRSATQSSGRPQAPVPRQPRPLVLQLLEQVSSPWGRWEGVQALHGACWLAHLGGPARRAALWPPGSAAHLQPAAAVSSAGHLDGHASPSALSACRGMEAWIHEPAVQRRAPMSRPAAQLTRRLCRRSASALQPGESSSA